MLEFCPVCKKLLELGEWKGKKVGKCSCGFIRTSGINIEGEEKIGKKEKPTGITQEVSSSGWDFLCSKCGYEKADVKDLGEILGNEKSVTLFTCLKCGNIQRR